MKAILYVAHGSKQADKNQAVTAFFTKLRLKKPNYLHGLSFLEAADPDIVAAGTVLIEQGATEIVVMPLLLFEAMHAKVDIPRQLAILQTNFPNVRFFQAHTFGAEKATIEVAAMRAKELRDKAIDHYVLFVHGSKNYPLPAMEEITAELSSALGKPVTASFIYGMPDLLTTLEQLSASQQVIAIIPYFLYDGMLVGKWKLKAEQQFPAWGDRLFWTKSLQLDAHLISGIERRIAEVTPE